MVTKKNNWFGNSNIKGYLFFLLFTTVLAIFIKLAKTYTSTATLRVVLEDVPDHLILDAPTNNDMAVTYESNGFTVVRNSFREEMLTIPYGLLNKTTEGYLEFNASDHTNYIQEALGLSENVLDIIPETLLFSVDSLSTKEVPVVSAISFEFASGFGRIEPPQFDPETVKVIGSKEQLDSIQKVSTKSETLQEVDDTVTLEVSLDTEAFKGGVILNPTMVTMTQQVEKFTEGSVTVPVQLTGASGRDVQLFPKEISLYYTVPISEYEGVKASDFTVTAAMQNASMDNAYLSLEVTAKPSFVTKTRLSQKQVQFVIVNE